MTRKGRAERPLSKKRSYDVGRGKPPVAHQFKKGQSGNPSGLSKAPKRKTFSTADLAVRALKKQITGRKGDEVVKMEAIEAIYQKRTELALKGDRWAIRECCADARAYGLLQDPRIVSLAQLLSPEEIESSSDQELQYLSTILKRKQSIREASRKQARETRPKLFNVGRHDGPQITMQRDLTVDQAIALVDQFKAQNIEFVIQDEQLHRLTEDELRAQG